MSRRDFVSLSVPETFHVHTEYELELPLPDLGTFSVDDLVALRDALVEQYRRAHEDAR